MRARWPGPVSNAEAEQLDMAVGGFRLAHGRCLALHGHQRLPVLLAFALTLRLVIACDHHRPIGALAAGVFRARDPDTGGIVQQQVLAMAGGVDPLSQRLLEIVVAIGDVLSGAPRVGRRDAAVERSERVVAEIVLGRHRARLVHGNAVEGGIADDADLTMLEAEAGDLLGRGFGHCGCGGQQQKAADQAASHATHHHFPSAHNPAKPALSDRFSIANVDASRRWAACQLAGRSASKLKRSRRFLRCSRMSLRKARSWSFFIMGSIRSSWFMATSCRISVRGLPVGSRGSAWTIWMCSGGFGPLAAVSALR